MAGVTAKQTLLRRDALSLTHCAIAAPIAAGEEGSERGGLTLRFQIDPAGRWV